MYSRCLVYFITLFTGFGVPVMALNYPIGHRSMTFFDASRNNRPVPTELFYPATTTGESTPTAAGVFPVIIFGHGFQMGFDTYAYFTNAMVPDGYILVYPTTETSLSPTHAAFGADLAFLVVQMKAEGINPASPFFQHIDSTSAIMGHSMGGGASFLGCKNNSIPNAMITWAAAETSPSAISAAEGITIPSLVFSADRDCVAPPATNQLPMYDSLASGCKVFINIKGGGHCYFADASFICSLGEIGCPPFTITRDEQHAATLDFTKPYLNCYLKGQQAAWYVFNDSLNNSPRVTFLESCAATAVIPGEETGEPGAFPNPSRGLTLLTGKSTGKESIFADVSDMSGRRMISCMILSGGTRYRLVVDMKNWPPGIYVASIRTTVENSIFKIVKY